MGASQDHWAAVRRNADLMVTDLARVSGMLEELVTLWRRAGLYRQQASPGSPSALQHAVRKLADDVRAIPEADSGQHPALALSAAAQLAALERDAARPAETAEGSHPPETRMRAAIQARLHESRGPLWSLICTLVQTEETPPAGDLTPGQEAPAARGLPASLPPQAAGPPEWQRALAMQHAAVDALPEAEVRRLLLMIGGLDPAALQRAAAAYTETFCGVAAMKASVAALQPVALAVPDGPPDPGPGCWTASAAPDSGSPSRSHLHALWRAARQ
jgi:hypothetical protein